MSKQLSILVGLIILTLSSCWETIELEPRSFPQLLSYEMSVVKAFDQGMFIVGGNEGFYVRFRDGSEVSHKLLQNEFENYHVADMNFFASNDKLIYGVYDSYLLRLTDKELDFYFFNSDAINSYRSFAVDDNGDLIMADYWLAEYEGSGYNYLMRINTWNNGSWDEVLTDLSVSDSKLDAPELLLDELGRLIILTNPIYRISEWKDADIQFEKFIPNVQGNFAVKSMHSAHTDGQSYFGFDREFSQDWDITKAYRFNSNSGIMNVNDLDKATSCQVEGTPFKLTKLVGTSETKSYGWIPVINNSFSNTPGLIGYVITYNHSTGMCESSAIADSDVFDTSVRVHDVSLMTETNELLIATSEGLFTYNLIYSEAQFYLEKVINL
ncbi:MAG: hypothetical protein R2813_07845 [Flavobacteriales bacterium]